MDHARADTSNTTHVFAYTTLAVNGCNIVGHTHKQAVAVLANFADMNVIDLTVCLSSAFKKYIQSEDETRDTKVGPELLLLSRSLLPAVLVINHKYSCIHCH